MADLGTLTVRINANTTGIISGMNRATASVQRASARMKAIGAGMSSVGRTMSLAVTAPLLLMGKIGYDELRDIESANAQTAASIARVGRGALVSADGIRAQASALQKLSGMDDQAIQSGANLLLTQGNLNVKTKEGAAAFKRATALMVNYAAATRKDPIAASKQLAKALADPENALSRVAKEAGITKDQQAKLKKEMKAAESPAAKQAILMRALEDKYKGAAKAAGSTFAARMAVLKDRLAGVSAEILTRAIPYVEKFAAWMGRLMDRFDKLSPSGKRVVAIIAGIAVVLPPLLMLIGGLVTALGAIIGGMAAVGAPVLLVVAALVALGVGLAYAWKRSATFRKETTKAFKAVKAAVIPVINDLKKTLKVWGVWLSAFWKQHGAQILSTVKLYWGRLRSVVSPLLKAVAAAIRVILAAMRGDWHSVWKNLKTYAVNMLKAAAAAIAGSMGHWKSVLSALARGALDAWKAVVLDFPAAAVAAVVRIASSLASDAWDAFTSAGRKLGKAVVDGVKSYINDHKGDILAGLTGILGQAIHKATSRGVVGSKGTPRATAGFPGVGAAFRRFDALGSSGRADEARARADLILERAKERLAALLAIAVKKRNQAAIAAARIQVAAANNGVAAATQLQAAARKMQETFSRITGQFNLDQAWLNFQTALNGGVADTAAQLALLTTSYNRLFAEFSNDVSSMSNDEKLDILAQLTAMREQMNQINADAAATAIDGGDARSAGKGARLTQIFNFTGAEPDMFTASRRAAFAMKTAGIVV